jgi:glycosyltransferase involved in cell wall biosynthesis
MANTLSLPDALPIYPDLLRFLPERAIFIPYVVAGWDRIHSLPYSPPTGTIKIVHAPTNRIAKGTEIIISTINRLQKEYKDRIELVLVENRSYDEALGIYKSADLVIDQILIGWYGSFAVEMMKLGKPVISFIREEDLSFISSEMANDCLKSIINVKPNNLYSCLKNIIENPKLLTEYQRNAEQYVNRWHNPEYVGGMTKRVYEA